MSQEQLDRIENKLDKLLEKQKNQPETKIKYTITKEGILKTKNKTSQKRISKILHEAKKGNNPSYVNTSRASKILDRNKKTSRKLLKDLGDMKKYECKKRNNEIRLYYSP